MTRAQETNLFMNKSSGCTTIQQKITIMNVTKFPMAYIPTSSLFELASALITERPTNWEYEEVLSADNSRWYTYSASGESLNCDGFIISLGTYERANLAKQILDYILSEKE